ncbi:MAG TPA: hypothetical protein VFM05_04990 [Candidatus Saccharimonadales bacterium]|nr:hypothetical protein [Candidatus Saccharimonadales bacterium]
MDTFWLAEGDECAVTVHVNGEVVLAVLHKRHDENSISTEVYTEDEFSLQQGYEALETTSQAVHFHLTKPEMGKLIKAAIARMNEEIARGEGQPPSPADDVGDIPF